MIVSILTFGHYNFKNHNVDLSNFKLECEFKDDNLKANVRRKSHSSHIGKPKVKHQN